MNKNILEISADYKKEWNKINAELKDTWNLYITDEGKFAGLTSYVMNKIYEAEARGRLQGQEAFDFLEDKEDEL